MKYMSEEYLKYLTLNSSMKKWKSALIFFSSAIPVIIFLATLFGGWQILTVSTLYQIPFLELAKTNIILIFCMLFCILATSLVIAPSLIVIASYNLGPAIYKYYILNSRFKCIRKRKTLPIIMVSLTVSVWPFSFMSDWWVWFLFTPSVILFLYSVIFTKAFPRRSIKTRLEYIGEAFLTSLGVFLTTCFGVMACYIIYALEGKYLGNLNNILVLTMIAFIYFLLFIISVGFAWCKNKQRDVKWLFLSVITALYIWIFIAVPVELSNKVIKAVGLERGELCFLEKGVEDLDIPDDFKYRTDADNIIRLNVVMKIDDVYYISANDQFKRNIRLRFVSNGLKQTTCPMSTPKSIATNML